MDKIQRNSNQPENAENEYLLVYILGKQHRVMAPWYEPLKALTRTAVVQGVDPTCYCEISFLSESDNHLVYNEYDLINNEIIFSSGKRFSNFKFVKAKLLHESPDERKVWEISIECKAMLTAQKHEI